MAAQHWMAGEKNRAHTEMRPYRLKRIHSPNRNQFKMVRVMALLLRSCGRLIIFTFPRNLCALSLSLTLSPLYIWWKYIRRKLNANGEIIHSIKMQANPLCLPAKYIKFTMCAGEYISNERWTTHKTFFVELFNCLSWKCLCFCSLHFVYP